MCHKIIGPISCRLLLSWAASAAPRRDDPPPALYCASAVGDKSVYEVTRGPYSWESVSEVTDARHNGAARIVTVRETRDYGASESYRIEVSDKGVYLVGEGDAALESPECYLRLPVTKGDTWETAHRLDGETYATKYTVGEEAEIEVPAGKFRCIRIESEFVFNGVSYTRTRWRAARCGTVKEVVVGQEGGRTVDVRTTVLKSFAPGGK